MHPATEQLQSQLEEEKARTREEKSDYRLQFSAFVLKALLKVGQCLSSSHLSNSLPHRKRSCSAGRHAYASRAVALHPDSKAIPAEMEHLLPSMEHQEPSCLCQMRLLQSQEPHRQTGAQTWTVTGGLTLRNMITKTVPNPKNQNRRYTMQMRSPIGTTQAHRIR